MYMGYYNDSSAILTCSTNIESIDSYVRNLTSSYTDKSNESSVVATSVFMLVLSAVFFNLNLFSRLSNTSAVLNPTARLLLSSSLSLFLPVMSYLLSEAKNGTAESDLPVRARLILTWMLLVELLRKKVDAILVQAGIQGYSGIINHAATVAWLGYLVFFNLKGAGRVALFGILWLLCAAKFLQRVAFTELGKRSFAYGKNARLLSSYMAQMLLQRQGQPVQANASERLKMCEYPVMGEENLVLKAGPHGYQLDLKKITDDTVVTVGKIWQLTEPERGRPLFKSNPRLKRLCLSFALFKLLQRSFENLPAMTSEETSNCRDLIFEGMCKEDGVSDPEAAVALFQVLKDEVNFLSEYRHSVHPVVLASPYFFVVNYFMVPAVVYGLCLMTVILCANGDMLLAFRSIRTDNYAISSGIFTLTKCLWKNVLRTPAAFFSTIDISISYLLFLTFIYEEVWEFLVFVLSNWFMVSLLCKYTAKQGWSSSPTFSGVLHRISWISRKLSHPSLITLKQFSVLRVCWLSMTLPTVSLPKQAKIDMMKRFRWAAYGDDGNLAPLSNGQYALERRQYRQLLWFCETDSVAEVIFTWHIATSLLEMEHPPHKGGTSRPDHDHDRVVATRLSKYCAYLVVFHPELLPDDREGTESVYKEMKKDLKKALGSWGYYFSPEPTRYAKMKKLKPHKLQPQCRDDDMTVVEKGIVLMKELMKVEGHVWELLAHLWVELVVYLAPSSGDEHVKGHEEALVLGGELVTLLWALATHTGMTRPPPTSVVVETVSDVEDGVRPS